MGSHDSGGAGGTRPRRLKSTAVRTLPPPDRDSSTANAAEMSHPRILIRLSRRGEAAGDGMAWQDAEGSVHGSVEGSVHGSAFGSVHGLTNGMSGGKPQPSGFPLTAWLNQTAGVRTIHLPSPSPVPLLSLLLTRTHSNNTTLAWVGAGRAERRAAQTGDGFQNGRKRFSIAP